MHCLLNLKEFTRNQALKHTICSLLQVLAIGYWGAQYPVQQEATDHSMSLQQMGCPRTSSVQQPSVYQLLLPLASPTRHPSVSLSVSQLMPSHTQWLQPFDQHSSSSLILCITINAVYTGI